jgi:hypothetical protein
MGRSSSRVWSKEESKVPEVFNAYMWVEDPIAESGALDPVFRPTEATEMNSSDAAVLRRPSGCLNQ